MIFKVGDIVEFGGNQGVVISDTATPPHQILAEFDADTPTATYHYFTSDGRFSVKHTKPLLNLVERPKKKVKKTLEIWANVYKDGFYACYDTAQEANGHSTPGRTTCVKLTGEYEVEE